jgi:hypothetical protein
MRYLTLTEGLLIASAVTGIEVQTIQHASRVELLDSALHAPQAGFREEDFTQPLKRRPLFFVFTSLEIIRCPMGTNDWHGWRQ